MDTNPKRIERQLTDNLSFAIIPKSKDVIEAACVLEDDFGNFIILRVSDLDMLEQAIPGIVKNMSDD